MLFQRIPGRMTTHTSWHLFDGDYYTSAVTTKLCCPGQFRPTRCATFHVQPPGRRNILSFLLETAQLQSTCAARYTFTLYAFSISMLAFFRVRYRTFFV